MKRKISLTTLFVLAALPLGALAAEPMQAPPANPQATEMPAAPAAAAPREEPAPLFLQLDTNHDSYLTKEEAKRSADITARFTELDADHDGRIAAAEFKKGMQAKL